MGRVKTDDTGVITWDGVYDFLGLCLWLLAYIAILFNIIHSTQCFLPPSCLYLPALLMSSSHTISLSTPYAINYRYDAVYRRVNI